MNDEAVFTTTPADLADPDPKHYDHRLALATCEHAVAVYQATADYSVDAAAAGFEGGTIVDRGAAQVGIAWSPRVIMVTPRGSDQAGDWVGNLASIFRLGWRPFLPRGARLGLGWRRQLRRISPKVLEIVKRLSGIYPDAVLVVGGHSLGAAMVPGMVAFLDHHGFAVRVAFLHEPPRPGNRAFRDWYDERFTSSETPTYTIVHVVGGESDLVTRVPLQRHGAAHLGRRIIHAGGCVLHGSEAWRIHRATNPVGYVAAWRVITRTMSSIRAHIGRRLRSTLRARDRETHP